MHTVTAKVQNSLHTQSGQDKPCTVTYIVSAYGNCQCAELINADLIPCTVTYVVSAYGNCKDAELINADLIHITAKVQNSLHTQSDQDKPCTVTYIVSAYGNCQCAELINADLIPCTVTYVVSAYGNCKGAELINADLIHSECISDCQCSEQLGHPCTQIKAHADLLYNKCIE